MITIMYAKFIHVAHLLPVYRALVKHWQGCVPRMHSGLSLYKCIISNTYLNFLFPKHVRDFKLSSITQRCSEYQSAAGTNQNERSKIMRTRRLSREGHYLNYDQSDLLKIV